MNVGKKAMYGFSCVVVRIWWLIISDVMFVGGWLESLTCEYEINIQPKQYNTIQYNTYNR